MKRSILESLLTISMISAGGLLTTGCRYIVGISDPAPWDRFVLLKGHDMDAWRSLEKDAPCPWRIENDAMIVVPGTGSIRSKQEFGDCVINLEFQLPSMPDAKGQDRANSGVYIQDLYEIQILDSSGFTLGGEPVVEGPTIDGCGSIYKQHAPAVNACLAPGVWQNYRIEFHAATFDGNGKKIENARVTVLLNDVTVQENVEIAGPTGSRSSRQETSAPGPLVLQDHGSLVRFRNVVINVPWSPELETTTQSRSLFDGSTLTGWHQLGGKAGYRAEDGCIVGATRPSTPNSFLVTDREYDDFELDLDFKVDPQLNSGVQFRSQSSPDYQSGRVHGYQAEIDPSERAWTAGIYDEGRRGWLASLEKNPVARKAFKQNQWNRMKIVAIGPEIRTFLNGVPAATLHDDMTPRGFIGLQVHDVGGRVEPLEVRWKNLKMRQIWVPNPSPAPRESFQNGKSAVEE